MGGANTPNQLLASKLFIPLDEIVGILGARGEGFKLETPIAVSLPELRKGNTDVNPISMTCTFPPSRSLIAGVAPLYGIRVI